MFSKLRPLPERKYDLNRFESYPHCLMNNERKESPQWRCYIVFDPELEKIIFEILKEHNYCEYYVNEISEDDLWQATNNSNNNNYDTIK